ncbi:MAG TPA: DNA mismatch repair protein MutS [Gemmatimonadales bacterium]|nr:DNA mismatch repair protein MutS [Gemmatimonadales bacterium]
MRRADTPLMQQYREIKARHQNAILMFRMGDFYEMFFDDAEIASRELGLTLTTRNNGAAAEVPLAGVPVKAVSGYLRRLVERGFRVAICEQVEDPRLAKGIVRREVVETVTPGAALEEDLLETTRNNFLVAAEPGPGTVGIAALDLSTGELALEVVATADVAAALERYGPREIVLPSNATLAADLTGVLHTEREPWEFDAGWAAEEIMRRFNIATLDGLGLEAADRPALAAAAALLRYAAELKPGGLPQLARPRVIRSGDLMPLDEMTRRNLELVELLRPDAAGLTLLAVLDRTVTPMGARLLRRWLLAPLRVPAAIRDRLDAVDVLFQDTRGRGRLREAADGVRDVERLVGRAVTGRATPRDLGALRDSLGRLPDLRGALDGLARRETSAELERLARELDLLTDLAEVLRHSLAERPPTSAGDGEAIRPGADPELDEWRELRDGGKRIIASIQARERERTGIASLKVGYNKVFGYYIEVTRAHRASIPADYERRQTLSGAERYVTPELKELEARVLGAEDRIAERERELLARICRAIGDRLERLQRTARAVAELDVYASLAEVAAREGYVRPSVTDEFRIELLRSRHPVVERMLPRGNFIPNDILLDEHQRVILLTGPNMAGKSTVLRQVGLLVVMAQMGSFVPAERATVGVVDRVFTRVGASDNLGRGQSTFMVEMAETSAILHSSTAQSLVLLDEIGRGTSTYDGVAIAWAVTEHLHDRVGCKTIFATHYHELTQLTEELAHARNFNVAVRESGDEVVFLHRVEPGGADRSYGIHVARLAGLPAGVVSRARQILALLESGHHVAGAAPPPAPDASQLALFDAGHPVLEDLRAIDPDSLTPLEALNRLAELRRRARELG